MISDLCVLYYYRPPSVGTIIQKCTQHKHFLKSNCCLSVSTPFFPSYFIQFFEMLLKFVAEGAASGLNVIAVYVSEILRATGVSGE